MPAESAVFKKELQGEIKLVLEMTARVDERIKLIAEKQVEMNNRLNSFVDNNNHLMSRVSVLEAKGTNGIGELKNKYETIIERIAKLEGSPATTSTRIGHMEDDLQTTDENIADLKISVIDLDKKMSKIQESTDQSWSRGKFFFELSMKGFWVIIVCWLLYRLGLNSSPIP